MAELPEDFSKQQLSENVDSVYPNMELKQVGSKLAAHLKNSNDVADSNDSSVPNAVVEEDQQDNNGDEDAEELKSKFKHVSIITDSDEFNFQQTNSNEVISRHNTISAANPSIDETPIAEEDTRAEEEETITNEKIHKAALKLNEGALLVENSLIVDKGEFECNSPSRLSASAHKKLTSSSGFASQFSAEVEVLKEEPEKEDDEKDIADSKAMATSKHLTANLNDQVDIRRVDEIHHTSTSTKHLSEFTDVQPIAEEEDNRQEDEDQSKNSLLKEAKEERDQEKEFIKKIVAGDKIKETEKLMQIVEASETASEQQQESATIKEETEEEGQE